MEALAEPLSSSIGQPNDNGVLSGSHEPRGLAEKGGKSAEDSVTRGQSQGPKEPPERWGEFFTRTGGASSGRGVGGKGIKRHPSSGEDAAFHPSPRFSPPARGFGSGKGFSRAHSPDDMYPPGENMSRKGRSVVLESRGLSEGRNRRGSTSLGASGGNSSSKVEKQGGVESPGLWPLVVGLQGGAQGGWLPQASQRAEEPPSGAARPPPPSSDWSSWLHDRSRQLSKDGTESGDNDSHSSDDISFAPVVSRRRLSEDLDLADIARPENPPPRSAFSFSPPGFSASPPGPAKTLVPSEPSPPHSDNTLSPPFSFTAPPDSVASMDTEPPPGFPPGVPPPRVRGPGRSLLSERYEPEEYMPTLLGPPLQSPPPPASHFGLPPPGPPTQSSVIRRAPPGNLFPPQSGSASTRGARSTGASTRAPRPSWLQNRPPTWDGLAEGGRRAVPVSDSGRPFVEDGVGAMFSHAEGPPAPFTLLPVHGETGDQTLAEGPLPPPQDGSPPPGLFNTLDPLHHLRQRSSGERPQETYQGGFQDRGPLLHRERAPPRLERQDSPRLVATNHQGHVVRPNDLYDEWDDWEERVDMDGDWWDVEGGGVAAPDRRARSPPRREPEHLAWGDESFWEPGEERGLGQRNTQTPPGQNERRGPLRRRRFPLFGEEGAGATRTRSGGLDPLASEPPARGGEEERAARRRGRSWVRELEGGGPRQPGMPVGEAGRSGLFAIRRGEASLGSAPRPATEAVLGRPPFYRNLRDFLSEAGGPPAIARRTPVEEAASEGGRGLVGLFREGGEEEDQAAERRARARRHRRMFEGREAGLPAPLLAMLNALEEAEQFQDLTGDQLIRLQIALTGGGLASRRRRELDAMRLDVDRMTYEELLELEERIGNVSVGLSPETVVEKLPITKWQAPMSGDSEKEIKCVVCQVEYEESEDVRILPCTHCYHADCIKSWLATKNECPVCKAKVVP